MSGKSKAKAPQILNKKYDDNELVKYDNELDTVPFKRFNSAEMSIFFAIVSQMRNKRTQTVRFSFSNLEKLSRYSRKSLKRFVEDLHHTYHKMLALTIYNKAEGEYDEWVLFTHFHISEKYKLVDISVNPDPKMQAILNNISRWTRFSLQQFNSLKSSYAKTIFRLCKKFRTQGYCYLSMKNFREQLSIPKSYGLSHIDEKILKPSKKQLREKIWSDFDYQKIKSKSRGNKVLGIKFLFKKEAHNNKDIINSELEKSFKSFSKKATARNQENPSEIGIGKNLHRVSNEQTKRIYQNFKKEN